MEIKTITYPEGVFRTHCRCNHDVTITIRPGQPILVTAAYRPSPKRRVRSLEDSRVPVKQG